MRIVLLLAVFLLTGYSFSQDDDTVKRVVRRYCITIQHEVEVDPISVWFNKGLSLGHRLKYTYLPRYNHQFSAETNGTWFSQLDAQAASKNWDGVFPRLNRTQLHYEYSRGAPRFKLFKKFSISSAKFRLGYHYFQHATGSANSDYWMLDSTLWDGARTIAGFRSHSILVGLAYKVKTMKFVNGKFKRSAHQFSVDYLFSPVYYLQLYNSANVNNPNSRIVQNFLPINRSGAQFAYHYDFEFSQTFGYHIDVEALWAPFLKNYQPNVDYFVPRGGEQITPLFINARAGLFWRF